MQRQIKQLFWHPSLPPFGSDPNPIERDIITTCTASYVHTGRRPTLARSTCLRGGWPAHRRPRPSPSTLDGDLPFLSFSLLYQLCHLSPLESKQLHRQEERPGRQAWGNESLSNEMREKGDMICSVFCSYFHRTAARPTLSQFSCYKIRRTTFLNNIKFTDFLILKA